MNERNVEALRERLEHASFAMYQGVPVPMVDVERIRATSMPIAMSLAALGVLVPSALTDDDLIAMTTVNWKEIGADFPAWLERIAKGEPRSPQQEER